MDELEEYRAKHRQVYLERRRHELTDQPKLGHPSDLSSAATSTTAPGAPSRIIRPATKGADYRLVQPRTSPPSRAQLGGSVEAPSNQPPKAAATRRVVKKQELNSAVDDSELVRRLQEEEDARMAKELAAQWEASDSVRPPDVQFAERLIDAPIWPIRPPVVIQNQSPVPGNLVTEAVTNGLRPYGNVPRMSNLQRRMAPSPLAPTANSHVSTPSPIRSSSDDEESQVRRAIEESLKDQRNRR